MSIIWLLEEPNTSSPLNKDASKAYNTNKIEDYKKICHEFYLKRSTENPLVKLMLHAPEWNSTPLVPAQTIPPAPSAPSASQVSVPHKPSALHVPPNLSSTTQ